MCKTDPKKAAEKRKRWAYIGYQGYELLWVFILKVVECCMKSIKIIFSKCCASEIGIYNSILASWRLCFYEKVNRNIFLIKFLVFDFDIFLEGTIIFLRLI